MFLEKIEKNVIHFFVIVVFSAIAAIAPGYIIKASEERTPCIDNVRLLSPKYSFSCDKHFDLSTSVLPNGQVLVTCSCKNSKSEVAVP